MQINKRERERERYIEINNNRDTHVESQDIITGLFSKKPGDVILA